jgi:hypothetical protein
MPVADPVRDDRTNVGPKGTVSMQFWALLKDSIRESLDRKIFWVVLAATLLVVLGMASIGFDEDRVSLCFGLWETTTQRFDPGTSVGRSALIGAVIFLPMQLLLGWVGLILILIATAGFFPTMMEPGAADVLLTKPISRPRLFLYKYACSLVFVLLQASAFVVMTFAVMGLRWGVWAPGYLLSVPLLVLLFSYVYCVGAGCGEDAEHRRGHPAEPRGVGALCGAARGGRDVRGVPRATEEPTVVSGRTGAGVGPSQDRRRPVLRDPVGGRRDCPRRDAPWRRRR